MDVSHILFVNGRLQFKADNLSVDSEKKVNSDQIETDVCMKCGKTIMTIMEIYIEKFVWKRFVNFYATLLLDHRVRSLNEIWNKTGRFASNQQPPLRRRQKSNIQPIRPTI